MSAYLRAVKKRTRSSRTRSPRTRSSRAPARPAHPLVPRTRSPRIHVRRAHACRAHARRAPARLAHPLVPRARSPCASLAAHALAVPPRSPPPAPFAAIEPRENQSGKPSIVRFYKYHTVPRAKSKPTLFCCGYTLKIRAVESKTGTLPTVELSEFIA